ncbi:MAG TPA: hypothetical protein PKZ84_11155 [Anaerolineae bacterium]|nr:hypothetical protein [Anaerolineae bacterium]HQI85120.1 hypothetical protein [Anaerolineae bacterium]
MRITKLRQQGRAALHAERWLWTLALLLVLGVGWLAGNGGWLRRLGTSAAAFWRDPRGTLAAWTARADFPALYLDLKLANFQQLTALRARALEFGAYLAEDGEVVPATLTLDNKTVDTDLSLPEIEAAALTGDRWPFVVTLRDGKTLYDMRQATLWPVNDALPWQRTLLSQSYRAALRARGLPTTASQVVRLTVNGANWGLYVMEETPLSALAAFPDHALVYFDRRAYLETQPVVSYDSFAYARIVVANATGNARDPALAALRADVTRILRGVEQGTYAPSVAFEPQPLADFMALTMLWRGDFALDWRSLYLLYNPTTRRFTPLGTAPLPGAALPLPSAFTNHPALQSAYVQALAAYSQPEFLAAVRDSEAWREDEAIAGARLDELLEHQARMRALVAPSRTISAALVEVEDGWQLTLTNVMPFPVEVLGLAIGDRAELPLDAAWVTEAERAYLRGAAEGIALPAQTTELAQPVVVRVPLTALRAVAPGTPEAVTLVTRIWGLDTRIVVPVEWGSE